MMDIIDAYYATAKDLERHGRELLHCAETLAQMADRMSESRMREQQSKTDPPPASDLNGASHVD